MSLYLENCEGMNLLLLIYKNPAGIGGVAPVSFAGIGIFCALMSGSTHASRGKMTSQLNGSRPVAALRTDRKFGKFDMISTGLAVS